MVNYKNGLIYKLVCNDLDVKHCYIGSTTCLKERKRNHKTACNNQNGKEYNSLKYKIIRDNGGFENWEMVLIHYYPCETKLELLKEERRIKEVYNDNMGVYIPSRTYNEYREENKYYIKELKKQWRYNNKDKIKDSNKQWNEKNKDKRKQYNDDNKDKRKQSYEKNKDSIKQYYEENKDKIKDSNKQWNEKNKDKRKQYNDDNKDKRKQSYEKNKDSIKQYYEENKDKINENRNIKIECNVCDCIVSKRNISAHRKSKKHINNLNNST